MYFGIWLPHKGYEILEVRVPIGQISLLLKYYTTVIIYKRNNNKNFDPDSTLRTISNIV
jgi:hypothetical protein